MEVDPKQVKSVAVARQWIATRIRDVRLARGMTQRELSNRMEVHFTRVSDLEANATDFKISTLLRACKGMGIQLEELVRGCPGWSTRAAKEKSMLVMEIQDLRQTLQGEGVSEALAERICAKLLARG
jgi:transcriptional regulator with XRE-family HTH domain